MGDLLGIVLTELGYIDRESVVLPIIAHQRGVDYLHLGVCDILEDALNKIPYRIAKRMNIMPVALRENTLTIAMTKPFDLLITDEIKMITECKIYAVLASRSDIEKAVTQNYGVGVDTIEKIIDKKEIIVDNLPKTQDLENIKSEATISNFLNQIFLKAYQDHATDIHIEPFEEKLIVRYRIDGVLYDVHVPENLNYFKDSISARIKIMSNLDISEKRLPQDGRFSIRVGDVALDLRISFIPTPYGESAAIRILNTTRLFSFKELNLSKVEKELLLDLIKRPHGIIFITGPTGSGKTTTLYSCLSQINTVDKKIITIEDPAEYRLPNITQIQVKPKINLTFTRGLRSVLRHDPDIIMVGEVRDVETAEIAIQCSLTGHLIFSTLHTNDAASGITRLLNMGIETYLITSTVECIIAQRLVRIICPHCKQPKKLHPKMLRHFGIDQEQSFPAYYGPRCEQCSGTGFIGRTAIYEFFLINEGIADMVLRCCSSEEIKKKAVSTGMQTLRDSGWEKIKQGVITAEEVIRVTQGRSKRK